MKLTEIKQISSTIVKGQKQQKTFMFLVKMPCDDRISYIKPPSISISISIPRPTEPMHLWKNTKPALCILSLFAPKNIAKPEYLHRYFTQNHAGPLLPSPPPTGLLDGTSPLDAGGG